MVSDPLALTIVAALIYELNHLKKEQEFTVISSGEILGIFHTYSGVNENKNEYIEISPEIWKLILAFDRQILESTQKPLFQYINDNLSNIHWIEGFEYYQKSKMKGKPFLDKSAKSKELLPPDGYPFWTMDCDCTVLALNQTIDPGFGSTTNDGRRFYVPKEVDSDKGSGEADQGWVFEHHAMGSSKFQYYQNSGWKTDCSYTYRGSYNFEDTQNGRFSNRSFITVRLTCNNGNELPDECGCEKRMHYQYDYDSRLSTRSQLLDQSFFCSNRRFASASAQDVAVVFYTKHDDLDYQGGETSGEIAYGAINDARIIDVLDHAVGVRCETPYLDSAFFSSVADAADALFPQIIELGGAVSSAFDTTNSLGDIIDEFGNLNPGTIINGIGDLWSAFRNLVTDCDNPNIRNETMSGGKLMFLNPNETVRFWINSNAATGVTGRRSWISRAENTSAFAHTLVINPGIDLEEDGCCTPWLGNYSGATFDPPRDQYTNHLIMGDHLLSYGMTECLRTEDGLVFILDDYGSCIRPSEEGPCDRNEGIILAEYNDYQIGPPPIVDDREESSSETSVKYINLYDLSGKMIGQVDQAECQDCILNKEYVSQKFRGQYTRGMYVISEFNSEKEFIRTYKIIF